MRREQIARTVLARCGYDFSLAERAGGWTNAVWLLPGAALRVSGDDGSDRLRREAKIAALLPERAGYPRPIASGVEDGLEWSLSERIDGVSLRAVWKELRWAEREELVGQIVALVDAVRSVPVQAARPYAARAPWYGAPDALEGRLARFASAGLITPAQCGLLLGRAAPLREPAATVLAHGDLTPDNLLYRDGRIVSLLDFEHCAVLPAAVDAHSVLHLALLDAPLDGSAACAGYVRAVMRWVPSAPLVTAYAILFRSFFLQAAMDGAAADARACWALGQLRALADGAEYPLGLLAE